MAAKKKTEVTEEIQEVEATAVVEEAPKKTSRKKKTEVVEEVQAEPEKVEEATVVEEVKEEPKTEVEVVGTYAVEVTEANTAEEKSTDSYRIEVVSPSGIFTFKNPGLDQPKGKVYARGSKLTVTEVKGNWAKVGEGKWIILSGSVIKI